MASKFTLFKEVVKHRGFIGKLPTLVRMVKAIMKKQYKPKTKNILVPALVVAYIISPIDILPDWIPVIGALDDIVLIALTMPMLMEELHAYSEWEERQRNIKTIDAEVVS